MILGQGYTGILCPIFETFCKPEIISRWKLIIIGGKTNEKQQKKLKQLRRKYEKSGRDGKRKKSVESNHFKYFSNLN